jgi:putative membrane protein
VDDRQPRPVPDARVLLAAERTLLAWLRTGLALMGFGFVVARFGLFLRELAVIRSGESMGRGGSMMIGTCLVGISVWILIMSAVRFRSYTKALRSGQDVSPPGPMFGLAVTVAVALVGIVMTVYLIALG